MEHYNNKQGPKSPITKTLGGTLTADSVGK